ncbi:MAG: hypothetical protein ABI702_18120 [Burkholderiales bacterium]
MLSLRTLAIAAATTSFGLVGCAQTPVDHDAHHPDAAHAAGMTMPMGGPGMPMARMDEQMKTMQGMHDRMMQAKTPEQRSALMSEHMKVMQDSMAMMGGMGPMDGMKDKPAMGAEKDGVPGMQGTQGKGSMDGDMGMHHQMMEKRMQMMQSIMQMMMDRTAPAAAKP